MFENFSFDAPVAVQRAETPAYSPTDCPPWHSTPVPSRPAHVATDARKLSLASTLSDLNLNIRHSSRVPHSPRSASSPSLPANPLSTRRAHSTTSALRARPSQADIRLQRIFLTQMQALAGSALVDFSVRKSGDDDSQKSRKLSHAEAGWRPRGVEKGYATGCGKRRKAFAVRAKWSLSEETQAQ